MFRQIANVLHYLYTHCLLSLQLENIASFANRVEQNHVHVNSKHVLNVQYNVDAYCCTVEVVSSVAGTNI